MNLPFSKEQFFEVFAAYNTSVWPAQYVLTTLAVALIVLALRFPDRAARPVSFGLALMWAWLAFAYHLAFFRAVNPAAPVFAAISFAAATAFVWIGIRGQLSFEPQRSLRVVPGLVFVVFALAVYPAIGRAIGHHYPAAPTFGLPCPTTIFTFGILLMASRNLPKVLVVAPLIWAVIGSSAAFALGVMQDSGLIAAAVAGAYLLCRRVPATDNALQAGREDTRA